MKSSIRDKSEGMLHQVKGKIKELVGNVVNDKPLKTEGKAENLAGRVQEKRGDIKKVAGK